MVTLGGCVPIIRHIGYRVIIQNILTIGCVSGRITGINCYGY